jgi:outer membrane lipoprotein SlyB
MTERQTIERTTVQRDGDVDETIDEVTPGTPRHDDEEAGGAVVGGVGGAAVGAAIGGPVGAVVGGAIGAAAGATAGAVDEATKDEDHEVVVERETTKRW